MPSADQNGVRFHYKDPGTGLPVLFLHEYGGDCRSWTLQVKALSSDYSGGVASVCGYSPSDLPDTSTQFGQDIAIADVLYLLNHLGLEIAHLARLSMDAYTTFRLALEQLRRMQVTAHSRTVC